MGQWLDSPNVSGYVFVGPFIIGFLAFMMVPMLLSFAFSFTRYNILQSPTFIGLENYITMFTDDPKFWKVFGVTMYYVVFSVPLRLIMALIVAMLLVKSTKLSGFYRAVYYLPSIIGSSVAVAILWKRMFASDGVINGLFGLDIAWLGRSDTAIWTLIILAVWQFGSSMLIFLSGLKQIPVSLYEAATMDGAGGVHKFFKITLPMLTPTIFFNLINQLINGFMAFTQSYIITQGKPRDTTLFYTVYMYQNAFTYNKLGYGCALAWFMILVVGILTLILFKTQKVDGERMKKGYKEKRFAIGVIYHIFTFCFACVMIYPLVWMVLSSFKDTNEIIRTASELIPRHFSLENYKVGWQGFAGYNFGTFFKNSFVIAGLSTIGAVASSAVIGYGFARINFKFKGFWFACMLLSMMLPFQVVMIPQYIIFNKLGWVGSYLPIIVPQWFGQGFFIFLNIQFIKGIPMDLDEAARMDGCSTYTIFFRIIRPLIKPSLVTSAIFSFMWRWDDFLAALLYLSDPLKYPVSYALKMFSDPTAGSDWGAMFAMATLSLIPIFVIFLTMQKYLVEGIASTGIKG